MHLDAHAALAMHLVLIATVLVFAMPITGFRWADGSNILLDPYLICKKAQRGKHYEMCKNGTRMLQEINRGISMGFRECEHQFKHHRWNCTSNGRSMRKILLKDARETSFVSAITAAGITYAVTRACTSGDLVECSCDKNHILQYNAIQSRSDNIYDIDVDVSTTRQPNRGNHKRRRHNTNAYLRNHNIYRNVILPKGDWQWGGCGDNVAFGIRKSKDFLDSRYQRLSDIRTLVKLHNNNAGRLAVKSLMRVECKCHGLSGSCTVKTCWLKMAPFQLIGNRLKERFDGAAKVIVRNDGHSFMPEIVSIKQPTRHDLVYTEDSVDFCRFNTKTGSFGTVDRECNATSTLIDGCDLMCCGRGYRTQEVIIVERCSCTFHWCCEVKCKQCRTKKTIHTCL